MVKSGLLRLMCQCCIDNVQAGGRETSLQNGVADRKSEVIIQHIFNRVLLLFC